ncbi:MAG TPA: hypothetical protein VFA59_23515, partial [Vicinamibacterales bacterium]|nr:hypothetical protein [Vicinamibacterales bacterium]
MSIRRSQAPVDVHAVALLALTVFCAASLLGYAVGDDRGKLTIIALNCCGVCALAYLGAQRLL